MTPGQIGLAAFVVLELLSVRAQAETIQVTVDKLVFAPAQVNAKVGDTIEWVNKDELAHTATTTNGDWNVNICAEPTRTSRCEEGARSRLFLQVSSQHERARGRSALRCG